MFINNWQMLKTYDIRPCTCVDAIQVTMMYYSGDEHKCVSLSK